VTVVALQGAQPLQEIFPCAYPDAATAAQFRATIRFVLNLADTISLADESIVCGTMHNLEILSFGVTKFRGRNSLADDV
jgi:hypothetical protein